MKSTFRMWRYFWSPAGEWFDVPASAQVFTYHRKSAGAVLLFGLLMAAIGEAVVVHVLLSFVNHWLALAATFSSVVFALQVVAQIRAFRLRPIYIHNGKLVLRNGMFDIAEISIDAIANVEKSKREVVGKDSVFKVCFPVSHNLILSFRNPQLGFVLNLKKCKFETALIFVDDEDRFVKQLRAEA